MSINNIFKTGGDEPVEPGFEFPAETIILSGDDLTSEGYQPLDRGLTLSKNQAPKLFEIYANRRTVPVFEGSYASLNANASHPYTFKIGDFYIRESSDFNVINKDDLSTGADFGDNYDSFWGPFAGGFLHTRAGTSSLFNLEYITFDLNATNSTDFANSYNVEWFSQNYVSEITGNDFCFPWEHGFTKNGLLVLLSDGSGEALGKVAICKEQDFIDNPEATNIYTVIDLTQTVDLVTYPNFFANPEENIQAVVEDKYYAIMSVDYDVVYVYDIATGDLFNSFNVGDNLGLRALISYSENGKTYLIVNYDFYRIVFDLETGISEDFAMNWNSLYYSKNEFGNVFELGKTAITNFANTFDSYRMDGSIGSILDLGFTSNSRFYLSTSNPGRLITRVPAFTQNGNEILIWNGTSVQIMSLITQEPEVFTIEAIPSNSEDKKYWILIE